MKKMVFCIIPLLMVLTGCASSAPAAKTGGGKAAAKPNNNLGVDMEAVIKATAAQPNGGSSGMDLDAAIKDAAAQMGAKLPAKTTVALVSVASTSAQLSEYIISRLEAALVGGGKLVVVDRANLDKVRAEQGFQLSGEVDDSSAKEIGRLAGAGAIVTGTFSNLGDVYGLTLKAIDMVSATVAVSYPADIVKSARIETLLASGGGAAGTQPAQAAQKGNAGGNTPAQAPAAATPPAPTYKIGDTGPAGGLIFYDKGNNSGGWRYLEAAPEDIARKLYATEEAVKIESQRAVGTGKANTQAIMVQANNRGGGFGWAAQACDALVVNGFDDWFLPSRDELHYMYGNLHMRNLGGFSLGWYWSSTFDRAEYGRYYWWNESFSDGKQEADIGNRDYGSSAQQLRIRAIRQF